MIVRTKFIRKYRIYIFRGPEIGNGYVGSEMNYYCNSKEEWRKDYSSSSKILNALIIRYSRKLYTKETLGEFSFIDRFEKDKREGEYIEKCNTLKPNGINRYNPKKSPGFNMSGCSHSDESRRKMRKSLVKAFSSSEIRERLSKSAIEVWNRPGYRESMRKKLKENSYKHKKRVSQYDLNGKFINSYLSIQEASILTGIDPTSIGGGLHSSERIGGGFQWRYGTKTNNIEAYNNPRFKPVSQFDRNGKFIKTYPSVLEATIQTRINITGISDCLNNKLKTSGGFIWERGTVFETKRKETRIKNQFK
jgi:hypothetical protein